MRFGGAVLVVGLLGSLLVGCSGGGDDVDGARDAVGALADALAAGDLEPVATTLVGAGAGDAQDELTQARDALLDDGAGDAEQEADGAPVQVEAGDVSVDGEDATRATAELTWTWDLGRLGSGEPVRWAYDTPVELRRSGEGDAAAWTVAWSPRVLEPSLRRGETLRLRTEQAVRGTITGAGGEPVVVDRPVTRVGLDKTTVSAGAAPASAERLAQVVGIDPAAYVRQVRAAGAKAYVEAIVLRAEDVGPRLLARIRAVRGALTQADELPLAPSRGFAAPLLGSVGPATAEIVADSDGRVRAGDETGLSGLQRRYDARLAGTPGLVVEAVPAEDGEPRRLFARSPVDGRSLRTTLSVTDQLAAERALAGTGPASALVALRPSTGAVLALANGPGSDGQPTASFGQYAPGSTFKVVTALALLRAGLTPTTTVPCPASVTVDGKRFENYDDYPASGLGRVPLRTAFANSCNTAFISERGRLDDRGADLAAAAAALGFGVDHDLGYPAYLGQVPAPESATGAAADLIGQGTVLASPLAMATVAASVSAGRTVLPRLLPDVEVDRQEPARPLTTGEAGRLRALMRAVVTDGSGRFLDDLPGGVLAKTGTAEYGTARSGGSLPTHAWMIAVQGDLAVAVFVERGASGSGTAGPLLERFLRSR